MNNETKRKSKTSTKQSIFSEGPPGSGAQRWINKKLKSATYESKSDLSCIALNQVEMDLVFEAIESAIRTVERMDGGVKDFALPKYQELRKRFVSAP